MAEGAGCALPTRRDLWLTRLLAPTYSTFGVPDLW